MEVCTAFAPVPGLFQDVKHYRAISPHTHIRRLEFMIPNQLKIENPEILFRFSSISASSFWKRDVGFAHFQVENGTGISLHPFLHPNDPACPGSLFGIVVAF
jgi:hypothetical protein